MPASPPVADPGLEDDPPAVGVPAVVAVVVTSEPGPWLEETLLALGRQDYPNLSVLVIDAASATDPTPRIAASLPSAYVRRLEANVGYAAAANEVIGVVEGASHYVLLHDDAAPDPDAVRLLVEEAFRSNAGVVAPKLVAWDDPRLLLGVGASADKAGVVRPYGRNELDQEQHDAVRDVFVAPGGCTLVRADLFEALGGFDAGLALFGEDLDLCWRAQVAGARVVVAPSARVRHREATVAGERALVLGDADGDLAERVARLQFRHRLRVVLKSYGPLHLLRVLPQLVVLMVAEGLAALLGGQRRLAGAVVDAWRWNLSRRAELRAARKVAQSHRTLKDGEVRRLQTRGSVRLAAALQGSLAAEERTLGMGAASRQFAGSMTAGGLRQTLVVWSVVAVVLAFGSRDLLSGRFPQVGQFVPFPDSPFTLLGHFVSGWRTSGLGAEAPAPPAFALLGMAGTFLLGAMGVLQRLVVLGLLPLALVGMHRLTAPLGSWRVRLAGVVLYAAIPLPYDALAAGRWAGLIAYAVSPWILGRLFRATGLEPFGLPAQDEAIVRRTPSRQAAPPHPDAVEDLLGAEAGTLDPIDTEELRVAVGALAGHHHEHHGLQDDVPTRLEPAPRWVRHPGSLVFQAAGLAALLAIVGAFVPSITLAAVLAGLGLVLGGALVGDARAGLRAFAVAFVASLGAALLLVPWTFELLLPGATWAGYAGFGRVTGDAPGLGELVRFATGPFGRSPLAWAFPVVALLPLVVGRRWRFGWAARLWMVAVVGWGASWALGRGWLGVDPPAVDVLLAPAAAALVLAATLGLSAFEIDLPAYRFGWRQVASLVAAGAAVVATLPVLAGTLDGQWRIPERDLPELLSWMPEREAEGTFRVLWTGDPAALPLDGWRLDDGLAYASSRGGPADVTELWPSSDQGSTGLLRDALDVARRGETSRLGHLLAPLGVRYVVVPLRNGGARGGAVALDPPDAVLEALRGQIDLRLIEGDEGLVVYENAAWAPAVSILPPAAVEASRRAGPDAARTTELAGAPKALAPTGATSYEGPWAGPELYFAESWSPRWSFDVDGDGAAAHRKAFGWANAWTAAAGTNATLSYRTSPLRHAALLLQIGLWVVLTRTVVQGLRERAVAEAARTSRAAA
ncbi:MAG TPA: glycosyltransferase family 2 protein [Acidimicrobiales bacterium]|nr:glycosyltransferase family 2 protein [Acidimicrobiales bacterium]